MLGKYKNKTIKIKGILILMTSNEQALLKCNIVDIF